MPYCWSHALAEPAIADKFAWMHNGATRHIIVSGNQKMLLVVPVFYSNSRLKE